MLELLLAIAIAGVVAGIWLLYRQMRDPDREIAAIRQDLERKRTRQTVNTPSLNGDCEDDRRAPVPLRRRPHPPVHKGGGEVATLLAALGAWLRTRWRDHHPAVVTTAAVTTAAGVATFALIGPGADRKDAGPHPAPPPSTSHTPLPGPTAAPGPPGDSPAEPGEEPGGPQPPAGTPEARPGGMAPDGGTAPPDGKPAPPPPSSTGGPPGTPTPSPSPTTGEPPPSPTPPGRDGLCLDLDLPPLLSTHVCLFNGQ
jgi:hypothetical protein